MVFYSIHFLSNGFRLIQNKSGNVYFSRKLYSYAYIGLNDACIRFDGFSTCLNGCELKPFGEG